MQNLTSQDKKEIMKLRTLFPEKITVGVRRSEDGGFYAEILLCPGCFTEGDTFSELIEMVNDAMMTYLEVPERYISFMPNYLPPLSVAQEIGAFPVIDKEFKATFTTRERVKS